MVEKSDMKNVTGYTPRPVKLSNEEIKAKLKNLRGWTVHNGKLHKDIKISRFSEAFGFMVRASMEIEKMNHHPEWSNFSDRITVDLVTHDAGGITQNDVDLAEILDSFEPPETHQGIYGQCIPICVTKLSEEEITGELQKLPGWTRRDGKLHRDLEFASFNEAFAFLARASLESFYEDKRLEWRNVYNRIAVDLATDDNDDWVITQEDVNLAKKFELMT